MFPGGRAAHRLAETCSARVDAVLVLTPGSHAPVAIAAAQAGVHVFVEKPMCFSVGEGEEMVAAAAGGRRRADGRLHEALRPVLRGAGEELDLGERDVRAHHDARVADRAVRAAPSAVRAGTPSTPRCSRQLLADDERGCAPGSAATTRSGCARYRSFLLDSMVHELNGVRGLLGEPTAHPLRARIFGERRDRRTPRSAAVEAVFAWVDLPGIARYAQDWSFYGPDRRATLEFPSPLLRS